MAAVQTTLTANDLPESLRGMRSAIERAVPHGRTPRGQDKGSWGTPPAPAVEAWGRLKPRFDAITAKHRAIKNSNHVTHLGTLGTGNHFIEVCLDEADRVWCMLHSGSRGVGNRIGRYFIELAKKDMAHHVANLPDKDLAYLSEGAEHFDDYVEAVGWAQEFALTNRRLMMDAVIAAVHAVPGIPPFAASMQAVNCFAAETKVLTRSGPEPIAALAGGIHELLTAGGQWVKAPVRSFGHQRLVKITLSRSKTLKVIHATPGHGWIVRSRGRALVERTSEQLLPGDRLAYVFPSCPGTRTLDHEGVQGGFVFGDGSKQGGRARAHFCGEKDRALLPFFSGSRLQPRHYKGVTVINGLPVEWKTVPPSLDSASVSYLYGWLAGYFAADGDVDRTGRPTLASSVRSNLEFARNACSRVGIGTFGIREYWRRGYGAAKTPLYLLGVMRGDVGSSFFILQHHRDRFERGRHAAERRGWNVVSIESTARHEEVFCAVVDGAHCFALEDNILTRNCHHNYVARERHYGRDVFVTRKGAVRAGAGDLGIIPGSMGTRSYIVRGRGNPESFESCSHGAGRAMSRGEAKRRFTLADHERATAGVECRKDSDVIDETPGAYKSIDAVMEAQKDLVEIVHTLRQVVCVKG
jgi:RNA-splicing ligase RtcB